MKKGRAYDRICPFIKEHAVNIVSFQVTQAISCFSVVLMIPVCACAEPSSVIFIDYRPHLVISKDLYFTSYLCAAISLVRMS